MSPNIEAKHDMVGGFELDPSICESILNGENRAKPDRPSKEERFGPSEDVRFDQVDGTQVDIRDGPDGMEMMITMGANGLTNTLMAAAALITLQL